MLRCSKLPTLQMLTLSSFRPVSIKRFLHYFIFSYWACDRRVIGESEGVVGDGQLLRSVNAMKMLIYRPCASYVVRGIDVRTFLAPCWP